MSVERATDALALAKPRLDVGLFTNRLEPMLAFWQGEVGLPFEELLPVGGGVRQYRHGANGSVVKINHARDPLPESPPSGFRELLIARSGLREPRSLTDPDGNRVTLLPPGREGISGIGLRLAVRALAAFEQFYGRIFGMAPAGTHAFRCGDTLLSGEAQADAAPVGELRAPGYRYLTVQVRDVEAAHAELLRRGATEGRPPITLGTTARISFVRDPDGNWIEVSQRASLTGPLPRP